MLKIQFASGFLNIETIENPFLGELLMPKMSGLD
jgi:hypothetical protein